MGYPLVNVYKTMENHNFLWENSLFLWLFSIAMLNYQRVSGKMWVNPWVNRMGWKTIWWGFRWPIHSRFTNFVACFEDSVVSNWRKDWIFFECYVILYYITRSTVKLFPAKGLVLVDQTNYNIVWDVCLWVVRSLWYGWFQRVTMQSGICNWPGITLESTSKYMLCWVQISLSFKSRTVLAAMSNFNSGDCHWKLVLVNQVLQPSGVYIHPSMHAFIHEYVDAYLFTYLPTYIYIYIHT